MNQRDKRKRLEPQPEVIVLPKRTRRPGASIGDATESRVHRGDVERPQRPER